MSNKILLVDDDLYIRELYDEVLKNEGFDVDTANNGKDGYDLMVANKYDLILLDVMLPQLDGIGVLTKLKEDKHSVSCPIVLVTNLAHDPAVKEALKLGAHSVITKAELNPDELVTKIREIIGGKTAAKAEEPAADTTPSETVEEI